jgi:hypothetical protein
MSDEQAGSLNKACSDYRCSHSLAVSSTARNSWARAITAPEMASANNVLDGMRISRWAFL